MRDRALSLLTPTFPPMVFGDRGRRGGNRRADTGWCTSSAGVALEISLGVVNLPGVLVVSTVWRLTLDAARNREGMVSAVEW